MLECEWQIHFVIVNNYPLTRVTVVIMGAIVIKFFHILTRVFDNDKLSHETSAIDTWRAITYHLKHGFSYMVAILTTIWRPGVSLACALKPCFHKIVLFKLTTRLFTHSKEKLLVVFNKRIIQKHQIRSPHQHKIKYLS